MKTYKEYSLLTDEQELHFDTLEEVQDAFNDLDIDDKESCQYFSKEWNNINGDYQEGEVILLDKKLN